MEFPEHVTSEEETMNWDVDESEILPIDSASQRSSMSGVMEKSESERGRRRRKSSGTSWVWAFMTTEMTSSGTVGKIKCNYPGCKSVYMGKTSTSNISTHLRSAHNITKETKIPGKETHSQGQLTEFLRPATPHSQHKNEQITKKLVKLMIGAIIPFHIVERPELVEFTNAL